VPGSPLEVGAEITRPGKRLQFARAWIRSEGREVLTARATLLRVAEVAVPAPVAEGPAPGLDGVAPPSDWIDATGTEGFHLTGMELRFDGTRARAGQPKMGWFSPAMPLVAGEEPSPLQLVAAAADFGNGLSQVLDISTHMYVNTDLTIHLHREPVGRWVGLHARTDFDVTGIGQATSVLHDERGRLGVAAQSLYVAER
jgi:hypothetical protein